MYLTILRRSFIILSALIIGCSGEDSGKTGKSASEKSGSDFQDFDVKALDDAQEKVETVPKPTKMNEMLTEANILQQVSDLGKNKKASETRKVKEELAVQCGALMSDIVLMVEKAKNTDAKMLK